LSFIVIRDAPTDTVAIAALLPAAPDLAKIEAESQARIEREVTRLRIKAEAEGRTRGEAEAGRAAQMAQAAHDATIALAVTALDAAWQQLIAPLAQKEEAIAELVTELAFVLARHIIGLEIALRPESVKPLVDGLIAEAARTRAAQQSIVIRLHPDDQAILAPCTRIEHAHLLADARITRGGTIVELIASGGDPIDKVEWDATIETRLETVRTALGLGDGADSGRRGDEAGGSRCAA
jgi:flagellar biosynthesis/type III secretory pathway protein FliH